jgi:carnitine O-acetyltransferase
MRPYSFQSHPPAPLHLPRLPIPPLRKTLDRYLNSIQPFLLEDEARGGTPFAESYALRVMWAEEFESGHGALAQDRLIG